MSLNEEQLLPIQETEELDPIVPEGLEPGNFPDSAATDVAAAASLMRGTATPNQDYDKIKQELINTNTSDEVEAYTTHLNEKHKETLAAGASLAISDPTLSEEQKTAIAVNVQDKMGEAYPYDLADETTLMTAEEALLDAANEEAKAVATRNVESLEDRLHYRNVMMDVVGRAAEEGLNLSLKSMADITRQMVSVDDVATYNEIAEVLDVEVDHSLAPGSILEQLKTKIDSMPTSEERANAAVAVSEYLKHNAGAVSEMFGSNMVNRVMALHDLFGRYISEDPDGWWERIDADEFLLDLGPVLDGMIVASGVGALAKAAQITGRLRRLAGLPRIDAANPVKGAALAEEAMQSEKVAEMAGVTAEELKIAGAPKVDGWKEGQVSGRTASTINKQAESQELLKTADEVSEFITNLRGKEEAIKSMDEVADIAKGKSFWVADTNLTGSLGKDWRASVLVGKTQDRGFDTYKAAQKALKDDFNNSGTILTRSSRIEPMKEIVDKGMEVKAAAGQVRKELEALRATKLSRGEEKALRKEANKLKTAIASKRKPLPEAGGTKASREMEAEQAALIEREISPLQQELNEIEHMLEVSSTGARAEADISRIDAGHYDKLSPESSARVEKLQKDVIVQEGKAGEESIEYFVQADTKGSIGFAKGDIALPFGGSKGTWMFDADSAIAPKIAQAGHGLFDKWKWAEQQLLDYLDPFAKLSLDEQIKVSKALSQGNKESVVFNKTDLHAMGIEKEASVEAYRSYRKFADIMFDLEDDLFIKTLQKENMKRVVLGDYVTYAKPISPEQAKAVKIAFDPEANTIVDTTTLKGVTLAKLRRSEFVGEESGKRIGASHIVVRGKTKVEELPTSGLLNRLEGYVPVTHKSNYFIVKRETVLLDGRGVADETVRETTVGVVGSVNEAHKVVDNLKDGGKFDFDFKYDRALTADDRSVESHMMDLHSARGTLFYGSRSDKGLEGFLGAADEVVDPLEAGVRAASRISRDITLRPFIDDMKARFIKSYNDLLPNPGVYPAHATNIVKSGKLSDWEVVEARRAFNHIETLEGLSTQAGFRRRAVQAADLIDGKFLGSESVAKAFRAASDLDPVGAVRSFNFNVNLRTNPLAQIVVQPAQTLNMLGIAPATFVQDFAYGRKLTRAARLKLDVVGSAEEIATFARTSGKSVDEVKADIKAFRESGMGQAVSAHETARDAAKPLSSAINAGTLGRAGRAITAPASKALNVLGQGFNRGEEINLGLHYLVARRKWAAKNPDADLYSTASQLEIAGEARALSGSMIQTGDFAYQKGVFAIPFQYAAIMHKQLLLMTTNKTLSTGEKLRLAAGQTAMWGPAGVGLGFLVEDVAEEMGINLSEGAAKFFNDGMLEWGLNQFLSTVMSEDTDLDFSGRFAPAAGLFGDNIFTMIADIIASGEARDIYKVFLGPTANNANRIENAIDTTIKMFGTDEVSYTDIGENVDAVLDVFSSWNNTTKALLYAKQDYFTDTKGRKLFRSPTNTELWSMGTIGLVPKEIDAYYKLKLDKKKWEDHLTEVSEEYYTHMLRLTNQTFERQQATDWKIMGNADEQFQNLLRIEKGIIDAYEEDAPIIIDKLVKKIGQNISTVGSDDLVDALQKLAIAHGDSPTVQALTQRAINTGLMQEEEREDTQNFLQHLTGE